jgi:hypothetical protein
MIIAPNIPANAPHVSCVDGFLTIGMVTDIIANAAVIY